MLLLLLLLISKTVSCGCGSRLAQVSAALWQVVVAAATCNNLPVAPLSLSPSLSFFLCVFNCYLLSVR